MEERKIFTCGSYEHMNTEQSAQHSELPIHVPFSKMLKWINSMQQPGLVGRSTKVVQLIKWIYLDNLGRCTEIAPYHAANWVRKGTWECALSFFIQVQMYGTPLQKIQNLAVAIKFPVAFSCSVMKRNKHFYVEFKQSFQN